MQFDFRLSMLFEISRLFILLGSSNGVYILELCFSEVASLDWAIGTCMFLFLMSINFVGFVLLPLVWEHSFSRICGCTFLIPRVVFGIFKGLRRIEAARAPGA